MGFSTTVLTLYPEMFPGPLGVSLAGRALAEGAWSLDAIHIRDFATDKHRTVDDTPAGGGAGMVLVAGKVPDVDRFERPCALSESTPGKADAKRPGKHLRVKGEDGSGEGQLSL